MYPMRILQEGAKHETVTGAEVDIKSTFPTAGSAHADADNQPEQDASPEAVSERGWAMGYTAPASLQAMLNHARAARSPARSITAALTDYGIAFIPAVVAVRMTGNAAIHVLALVVAALFVARAQRGLEVLMHEASHRNWTRNKRLNDFLSMTLAGAPILADLSTYRASHLRHHRLFGTKDDVDLQRYRELALDDLDRTRAVGYAAGMLRRMPRYWWSWYASAGMNIAVVTRHALWLAGVGATTWALLGRPEAIEIVGLWVGSMAIVLPVIRFIGEAAEHVYQAGTTVFSTTVSNIGILHRVVIHPHGDGYHAVHHLYQTIPHWRLANVHCSLRSGDPDGFGALAKVRTKILQTPADTR